jgi:hypothetical protein
VPLGRSGALWEDVVPQGNMWRSWENVVQYLMLRCGASWEDVVSHHRMICLLGRNCVPHRKNEWLMRKCEMVVLRFHASWEDAVLHGKMWCVLVRYGAHGKMWYHIGRCGDSWEDGVVTAFCS